MERANCHSEQPQLIVTEQQTKLGFVVNWFQEQETGQIEDNKAFQSEKQNLTVQVEQLRQQVEGKDKTIAKVSQELALCKESNKHLRIEVRQKEGKISEMQSEIRSLEGTMQQLQQQKKGSFSRLSGSKFSFARSSSSPDVHSTGPASKRKGSWKKSRSVSSHKPPSPTQLAPLLELSNTQDPSSTHLLDGDEDGSLDSPSMSVGNVSQLSGASSYESNSADNSYTGPFSPLDSPVDVSELRWREGKRAPEKIARGSSTVHGNTAYFRPSGSNKVYACSLSSGKLHWSNLPDGNHKNFSLAVIGDWLTGFGGQMPNGDYSSAVLSLSLTGGRGKKRWSHVFPAMPTARCNTAAVATAQCVVVAGGYDRGRELDTVEVLHVHSKQWSSVQSLPQPLNNLAAAVFEGKLYLASGFKGQASKSVFTCSLSHILGTESTTNGENGFSQSLADTEAEGGEGAEGGTNSGSFWRQVSDLPVANSTIVKFAGNLLAVGGLDESNAPTGTVYKFDPDSNAWRNVCVMRVKRERCFVASFQTHEGNMVVVGGFTKTGSKTDHVEIADVNP